VDPKLFRTGEIHDLRGDSSLARLSLNWRPEVDFKGLVSMMVESDALGRKEARVANVQLARSGA
jgi:GDP-D-mannose dehydratase